MQASPGPTVSHTGSAELPKWVPECIRFITLHENWCVYKLCGSLQWFSAVLVLLPCDPVGYGYHRPVELSVQSDWCRWRVFEHYASGGDWCLLGQWNQRLHRGGQANVTFSRGTITSFQFYNAPVMQILPVLNGQLKNVPRCELRIGRVSESNRCYTVRKGLWERTTLGRRYFFPPTL